MKIVRVALPVAAGHLFDYLAPTDQKIVCGNLVRVRLAHKPRYGVVMACREYSEIAPENLLPVEKVYDLPPLPDDILKLLSFVSDYYHADIGMSCALALPPLSVRPSDLPTCLALEELGKNELLALRENLGKRKAPQLRSLIDEVLSGVIAVGQQKNWSATQKRYIKQWRQHGWLIPSVEKTISNEATTPLFEEQRAAVAAIDSARDKFQVFLLQGVTGSGKTEVYLTLAREAILRGKQALILLPEIHLTPQFLQRAAKHLPNVKTAVLHSGLPDGERFANWRCATTGDAQLILGTRLAIFTPLPALGLIVIDEEHDASFKQQDGVRYHARDLAIWRARQRNVPIMLGSATPSLETYYHAQQGRYQLLRISRRANEQAMPNIRFVPLSKETTHEGIAPELWDAIHARLERNEQSLIFINRRGFSPSLKCHACGWEATCPRCSVRLVLHKNPSSLRCHQCNYSSRVFHVCPSCGNIDLLPRGFGTQRLETALTRAFPNARIARIDRDSTQRRGAFDALQTQIAAQNIDIMIGTQMLAKGHDFPAVTLVGVLGADNALYSADFRATERLSALLHQVAGRAGRAERKGEVIVQTDFPQYPLFDALQRHAFNDYAAVLLEERKAIGLPPFVSLALLSAEARDEKKLLSFLQQAHEKALACANDSVHIFPPVSSTLAKRAGFFRMQMIIRSANRSMLQRFLREWKIHLDALRARPIKWIIDVDPMIV
ncbi:MAG: primosomal protein N' [Burkholderiales bacterium]|jgi:primosomal protein N' (replication factor Y)|nr:primosomal protein N' [Burkholderiales bacterium]